MPRRSSRISRSSRPPRKAGPAYRVRCRGAVPNRRTWGWPQKPVGQPEMGRRWCAIAVVVNTSTPFVCERGIFADERSCRWLVGRPRRRHTHCLDRRFEESLEGAYPHSRNEGRISAVVRRGGDSKDGLRATLALRALICTQSRSEENALFSPSPRRGVDSPHHHAAGGRDRHAAAPIQRLSRQRCCMDAFLEATGPANLAVRGTSSECSAPTRTGDGHRRDVTSLGDF